jgi:membrane-anchored protein YejM (alkaline phosphatase superfamily)
MVSRLNGSIDIQQVKATEEIFTEEYHDTSDFDAAINEVLDHLHATQKLVSTPA